MENAESVQKPRLTFYGSGEQRKHLDEEMPGIARDFDVQYILAFEQKPVLHGCGAYARGWHQIGAVFDPDLDWS